MMEDQAASLYDPYKRIQAQQVWDAKSLLTNLQQQNEAMVKQTQNLAKARSLGISQQVLDQLKLSDSGNSQQLERFLQDIQGNPNLVGQFNSQAGQRQDAATGLTQESVSFKRQTEDFNQGLKDSNADFKKSMKRAENDFNTSLADSRADFNKQMTRAQKDFDKQMARGEWDYNKTLGRAERQYNKTLLNMDADLARSRRHAQEDLVHMAEDTSGGIQGIYKEFMARTKALPNSIKKEFSENLKATIANAGTDLQTYLESADSPYQTIAAWLAAKLTGGPVNTDESNRANARDHQDSANFNGSGSVAPTRRAAGVIATAPEYAMIGEAGPEAVIPLNHRGMAFVTGVMQRMGGNKDWLNGGDANGVHVPTPAEFAAAITAQGRADADMAKLADERKRMEAEKKALEADKKKHELAMQRAMADFKRMRDHMAHANHAARMSSGVNVHHVDGGHVRAAGTARHSSPVTNNFHYDNRTQFTGPITVKADDPNKMAAELKRRVAHSRLVSPGRAGLPGGVA